jgi:hypothetical protein
MPEINFFLSSRILVFALTNGNSTNEFAVLSLAVFDSPAMAFVTFR